jgi:hypothetical protein
MIDMPNWMKAVVAEPMNALPEVRWDRMSGEWPGRFNVYGWIDRTDGRSDFALLVFDADRETKGHMYEWSFTTSSAEWSVVFMDRLNALPGYETQVGKPAHHPCQRVEDVLGDIVDNAIALETTDPMRAGGNVAGPEDPHGHGTAVVDINRAVMVDGIGVVIVDLQGQGEPPSRELAFGLFLEGDVNRSDPREHAKVLSLMGVSEVAGLICELQAAPQRYGGGLADELLRQLKKRWKAMKEDGLTS